MYSILPSRAGLAALAFVLIISLVSAVPIPLSASLSSTLSSHFSNNHNEQIHHDTINILRPQISLNGPISMVPGTISGGLTVNNTPIGVDNHLVRRNLFSSIRAGFRKVGHAIAHVAQKVGAGIKRVAQNVGSGIKTVAQKVGSGIHTVVKKAGTFVRHAAGAAKFGLKVLASVTEAASKVAGFIPGFGKPLGKVLEGVSKASNIISDKIHAHLNGKLEEGMEIMNKADKIMGYIPRRRDLSAEDGFQQWDDM